MFKKMGTYKTAALGEVLESRGGKERNRGFFWSIRNCIPDAELSMKNEEIWNDERKTIVFGIIL